MTVSVVRSTSDIASEATRYSAPDTFFGRFQGPWGRVTQQVRKIETRQAYREPGNPSWQELVDGSLQAAIGLVPAAREVDVPLYASLRQRRVRFTRCRPISYPLTSYLRWEIACYDFNTAQGEEIFFAHSTDVADLLRTRIHHDFMVFDQSVAFIHDYDERGEIGGGWETTDSDHISALTSMFEQFRVHSIPYRQFLGSPHGHSDDEPGGSPSM